jgi:phage-related minor tail protein
MSINIHRESDLRHERMMEERLNEDRRVARETAMQLLKAAAFAGIMLCVCFTLAAIGAAIILPFIK